MDRIYYLIIYLFVPYLITVFFHELAHSFVAIACKIKVEAFSIGFGKILIHKVIKGIDFRLSLLPFGGYCKLEGDNLENKTGWLTKSYSKKVFMLLAGVFINLVIALICYLINYKSIKIGLLVDIEYLKYLITEDGQVFVNLLKIYRPNFFLLQLGFINLFAFIFNILPFPGLDRGYIVLLPLEKILKDKFVSFLNITVKLGFAILMVLQVWIIHWRFFL